MWALIWAITKALIFLEPNGFDTAHANLLWYYALYEDKRIDRLN